MDHEDITYLAPDTDVLQRLMARVLEDERGEVGLKLLPFVDTPGITYNYRVAFEDGTGDVIREETIPFVDAAQEDAQQALGERVVEGDSVAAKPDVDDLRTVLDAQSDLRTAADRYVSVRVNEIKTIFRRSVTRRPLGSWKTSRNTHRRNENGSSPSSKSTSAKPTPARIWTSRSEANRSVSNSSRTESKRAAKNSDVESR